MKFGCLAHFGYPYGDSVDFARQNNFDFLQLWYDSRGISLYEKNVDPVTLIDSAGFPTIVHAVLDVNEFNEHCPKLLTVLHELGHTELIIHPVSTSELITRRAFEKLIEHVRYAQKLFRANGITLYLENNSRLDPIFSSADEVREMFTAVPRLEFLLDIAHIDDYEHLKNMVAVKYPGILHIADRHFNVIHEHLPIGDGDIDFKRIFADHLSDFNGKIIFEITQSREAVVQAKHIVESLL